MTLSISAEVVLNEEPNSKTNSHKHAADIKVKKSNKSAADSKKVDDVYCQPLTGQQPPLIVAMQLVHGVSLTEGGRHRKGPPMKLDSNKHMSRKQFENSFINNSSTGAIRTNTDIQQEHKTMIMPKSDHVSRQEYRNPRPALELSAQRNGPNTANSPTKNHGGEQPIHDANMMLTKSPEWGLNPATQSSSYGHKYNLPSSKVGTHCTSFTYTLSSLLFVCHCIG